MQRKITNIAKKQEKAQRIFVVIIGINLKIEIDKEYLELQKSESTPKNQKK